MGAARYWSELGRRWPWTRQPDLAPVYSSAGEFTVALLRLLPALQWSNQARWYRRVVRDTPAILALTPDALTAEASKLSSSLDPRALDGKTALSIVYLTTSESVEPDLQARTNADELGDLVDAQVVAKTLLATTTTLTTANLPQLAHELLNCFCHTEWDGQTLRSGLRALNWGAGARLERGAALNDLLLDAMLVNLLPAFTTITQETLLEGALGPYWRIARALAVRLRGTPTLAALFSGAPDARERFERGAAVALDTADASDHLDRLAAAHDWAALQRLVGEEA